MLENVDFSTFFCFRVTSPYGTDGQARHVMQAVGRLHKKCFEKAKDLLIVNFH